MLSFLKKSSKEDSTEKFRSDALESLKLSLSEADTVREEFILKLQSKNKYDPDMEECKPLDFREASKIEYTDDVFIKDLSTDEQIRLGLNVFHVKIDKTTSSPPHFHEARSQVLYVVKGSVYDDVAKMRFEAGESFFISKRNKHSVKYIGGSELLFIYMPSLKVL